MRAALLQISSCDDPLTNLSRVNEMIASAVEGGAGFVLTPEVTNIISQDRQHQNDVLHLEADDPVLAGLREAAATHGIWLAIGSLAIKTGDEDGRFANRSFVIAPDGSIRARYDKIHMFDVQVSETETFRESAGFRPGEEAVTCETPFGTLGLTVCYDVRFPYLHRALCQAGATILLAPAAFSPVTGAAHWEPLLRARAIENGAYVLAAAQTGNHAVRSGKPRQTYGHSMVISPWGEVLVDAGVDEGIVFIDLDPDQVAQARARVPSLLHDRVFRGLDGQEHK